ncbi:hypothetical protein D3C72_2226010 [compost metagenome]
MQVADLNRAGIRRQHALIGDERHCENIDQVFAGHVAGGGIHLDKPWRDQPDHVDEQGAGATGGIEAKRRDALR